MISRTYFVKMPTWTAVATEVYLDIMVEGVFNAAGQNQGQGGPVGGSYMPCGLGGRPIPDVQPVCINNAVTDPLAAAYVASLSPTATSITPPAAWFGHPNGVYWEVRARPLAIRPLAGVAGFDSQLGAGWEVSVYPCNIQGGMGVLVGSVPTPDVQLSQSLLPAQSLVAGTFLPDPPYGPAGTGSPVIRLFNSAQVCSVAGAAAAPGTFMVHLWKFDSSDEDRSPTGAL